MEDKPQSSSENAQACYIEIHIKDSEVVDILKDGVLMELFSQKNTNNNNNINDVSSSTSAMYKICEKDSDLEYNETKKQFKTLEKALNVLADNVKTLQNQNLTVNCQLKKLKTKLDGKMTTTSAPGKKRIFPETKRRRRRTRKSILIENNCLI
ncbi:hypothetical protein BgiBS90_019256 [Biomphalaria glabrata]|nr:hypothetical protein BgiBS90_019256 [Biomphalaria glabrata]